LLTTSLIEQVLILLKKEAGHEKNTGLAGAVRDFGGLYTSHIRNEGVGLMDAYMEAVSIGERAGVRRCRFCTSRRPIVGGGAASAGC